MLHKPTDLLARRAFVDLVAQHVVPGSVLLDFGCGTGLDAFQYARRGYKVLAYDNSPGMIAELETRCEHEIDSAQISTCSVRYPEFIDRFPWPHSPHAVVSNFAVLNMIVDLESLFDFFARQLAPPGWMILSILNPIQRRNLRAPRWWSIALQTPSREAPVNLTEPYPSYLHFEPALLRAARRFHLVGRANAGAVVRYDSAPPSQMQQRWWRVPESNGGSFRHLLWQTPAHRIFGDFVFLVLRRDP